MAFGEIRVVGRRAGLTAEDRARAADYVKWVVARMPQDHRIEWALAAHEFTVYLGGAYDRVGGYLHSNMDRAIRRARAKAGFRAAIHMDCSTLVHPLVFTDVLVHELRHAADYQWEIRLLDAEEDFYRRYAKRVGMVRGHKTREAVSRAAERRAKRAVDAFHRNVSEREIMEAFAVAFPPEVHERMCPFRVRLRFAMRRVGR